MEKDDHINLIIIEEDAGVVSHLRDVLQGAGHRVSTTHITEAEGLNNALARQEWDLILAAPQLGEFSARQALSILSDHGRDIPFIVVAAQLDDAIAIEVLRAGAHAAVAHQPAELLQLTIQRELQNYGERRALRSLQSLYNEYEGYLRYVIERFEHKERGSDAPRPPAGGNADSAIPQTPAAAHSRTVASAASPATTPVEKPSPRRKPVPVAPAVYSLEGRPLDASGLDKSQLGHWKGRFQHAFSENRFRLVFQPVVNFHAEPTEKYEILLRMLDDRDEEIRPSEFIPQAIECGLMQTIDRWVVLNAAKVLAERRKAGHDTHFFIKLWAGTISAQNFLSWLENILGRLNLPGNSMTMMLSEPDVMNWAEQAREFMESLSYLNCSSGLEHVGLQEEPLAVANELPVSYLKIDRSLTLELSNDYNKQKRLREIVHFARSNEQEIIAPYVQDPYILSSLWRYGIDYVQGFYIQPPKSMLAYDFSSSFS